MSRKRPNAVFDVHIYPHSMTIIAKTAGAAFRLAVRALIKRGAIKRQPPTVDGWFENTSVYCRK